MKNHEEARGQKIDNPIICISEPCTMMPTRPTLPTALILSAALGLMLSAPAQASAVDAPKPKNRLASKIKPKPPTPPVAASPEEDTALDEAQLEVAPRVHHGEVQCEMNQKVSITPHTEKPGRFKLQFGKMVYNMTPHPTTTGAVRLEDRHAGVVWLQIPAKSMLMNSKIGQRMADSCMHPQQVAFVNGTTNVVTEVNPDGLGRTN